MTSDWNNYAEGWDDNADVVRYAELAFASLKTMVNLQSASWKSNRILDFGCGTGLLVERTAQYVREVVAIDTSEKMISVLKQKNIPNVLALQCDLIEEGKSAFAAGQAGFDLIYASSVFAFLPDYESAVLTLTELLNPGGHFVQWDWLVPSPSENGLTQTQIENALRKAKLSAVHVDLAFELGAAGNSMPVIIGSGVR